MICEVKHKFMYFKHCPIKEHIGGNCLDCKFKDKLQYKLEKQKFVLKRKKAVNCQFYLVDNLFTKYDVNQRYGKVIEI